ncbi:MAG TPA: hypothetical protein VII34_10080 [Pyrinomonadaceae bacterium]
MPLLNPSKAEEVLNDLKTLASLLELDVIETTKFPTVMMRVSRGDKSIAITKQGSDFLATDVLPKVPMTFIGGGMFHYRLEV